MTHDYEPKSDLTKDEYESNIPKGLLELVTALHRCGYSYENIRNLYLRRHLEKYDKSGSSNTTTPATPRGRSSTTIQSPSPLPSSSLTPTSTSPLNPARMFSPGTKEHKRYEYLQRQIDSGYEKLDKRPMSSGDRTQLMGELSQLLQEKNELVMNAARSMKQMSRSTVHKQLLHKQPSTSIPSSSVSGSPSSSLWSTSPSSMLCWLSSYISDQDTTPVTRQLKRLRPTDTRTQRLDERQKTKRKSSL